MASNEITGARYIAEALKHFGVTHVFFMDAILRRTLVEMEWVGITRVLAHSEKAAAYMADAYARVTGRVGVCMAQSVGAANLAAGLQDAWLHRAPVLAITGRKPAFARDRNAYQEVEHAPLYAPVTKMHADVDVIDELPRYLEQAFREATDGTPRPVHLDLNGLGGQEIENATLPGADLPNAAYGSHPVRRLRPDPAEIEAAAARLAKARKPVLVAGAGAVQAAAHASVQSLAETLSIPIATSLGGRGIVPTTHALHVGVVGTYSAPVTNQLVHEADLVIYVGCHAGDQVSNDWTVPAPGTAVIQIDVDGREVGRSYSGVSGIVGDPGMALNDLAVAVDGTGDRIDWARDVGARFDEWRDSMAEHRASDAVPMRVERLCHELSEVLPEDAILVADTGYSGIWTSTVLELRHPGQTYLRAAGSLGWSLPAALGAKAGAPDRPVVCFTGDGGVYYHVPELETAQRRGLPVVVVVNNNSGFGQGVDKVRDIYGDTPGNPDDLNRFNDTNFADVARAFGVEGIRVERPGEIRPALERALSLDEPVLVDVVTDREPRAPAPWTP
ncbi:MAG: thiamine pyrophosphate-binding protein [Alphaproteobacteria bacterium]|nr:thiamine pyrophosphate-binding protein [Alphaproteobacteria bacterium]MCY4498390.1 thiamine pyrophosphate-binding protein [Rhodospirillaceae bacterium]